jgi:hypothetical protein
MLSSLVVHSDLDFVRLVNGEFVQLVYPLVISRRLGASLDRVFDLDVNESFGAAAETTCGGVVDVGYRVDA